MDIQVYRKICCDLETYRTETSNRYIRQRTKTSLGIFDFRDPKIRWNIEGLYGGADGRMENCGGLDEGRMTFRFTKSFNIYIRPWHSINLIPFYTAVSVYENDTAGKLGGVFARCYSVTIFGFIFEATLPSLKERRHVSSKSFGPAFSRRRKDWYPLHDPRKILL